MDEITVMLFALASPHWQTRRNAAHSLAEIGAEVGKEGKGRIAEILLKAWDLEKHPAVAWVNYAGLPGNKYQALAKKYLPKGAGSVFTFGVKGGYEVGVKVVDSVELFSHLANIGDAKSLIIHPASTTHRQLSDEQRVAAGAGPDVVRLSIGIETAEDIIADLEQALARAAA